VKRGSHHTEASKAAKRRAMTGKRLTKWSTAKDVELLRLMGVVMITEFAERTDCDNRTARRRLDRLIEEGLATRFMPRGWRAYRYTATIPPGATEVDS
jgi:hypothetical protein